MQKLKALAARVRAAYAKLPNAWKAGINTTWIATLAAVSLRLPGWAGDVQKWTEDRASFPSIVPLIKAGVGGLLAGAINVIYRTRKPGPQYPGSGS
jgi:hypothetical protein